MATLTTKVADKDKVSWKITVLIICNMMLFGHRHFNEFLAIEGINPKTLSQGLKEMQKNDIIGRKVTPGTPVTIEYYVTEKGMALKPALDHLLLFSLQHYPAQVCKGGQPKNTRAAVQAGAMTPSPTLHDF